MSDPSLYEDYTPVATWHPTVRLAADGAPADEAVLGAAPSDVADNCLFLSGLVTANATAIAGLTPRVRATVMTSLHPQGGGSFSLGDTTAAPKSPVTDGFTASAAGGGFIMNAAILSAGVALTTLCRIDAAFALQHGKTLSKVRLGVRPAALGRASLPTNMPRAWLLASYFTGAGVSVVSTVTLDPSATVAAYEVPHFIDIVPSSALVVDVENYSYALVIQDESGGGGASAGTHYRGAQCYFT